MAAFDYSDVISDAEAVVTSYTVRRLNAALHSKRTCGCRSCTVRAQGWLDWAAGEDAFEGDTDAVPIMHDGQIGRIR